MGKIKNHNDFCEFVESQNYKLLSSYIKSNIKVSLQCPENHIFEMKPANFKFGQRCPECYKLNKGLDHRLTYEHVKTFIEDTGYKLLSETYETAHKKLLVRCPEGHEYEVKYSNFYSGKRCKECSYNNSRIEYNEVKLYFESFGYLLISDTYYNMENDLIVQCPEGHIYNIDFHHFKCGNRCPECSSNASLKFEYVKEYIKSFGYELLSTEYINNSSYLLVKCDKGHQYLVSFSNFKAGHRCNECIDRSLENSSNWNGGITHIRNYIWSSNVLNQWKKDSMKQCNYKCIITGDKFHNVHHLYAFDLILNEILDDLNIAMKGSIINYTIDELNKIIEKCKVYHDFYGLGVCLNENIHLLFHKLYGFGKNIPEQFEEFKTRLRLGEFDDFLKEYDLRLAI